KDDTWRLLIEARSTVLHTEAGYTTDNLLLPSKLMPCNEGGDHIRPSQDSPHRRSTRPGCENALPDAERCWPRSHRGGAPTRTKPLRSGCEWRSAGALHPAVRTSWCSSLPGDHRTVRAPAPGAKTCPPRSHRGGAPTRA